MKSTIAWSLALTALAACGKLNDGTNQSQPFGPKLADRVTAGETLPSGRKLTDAPVDWRRELVYFVMIDRFADGDVANNFPGEAFHKFKDGESPQTLKKFQGGDLAGLKARLPHIRDLGATALWLTPVYDNSDAGDHSYHSYHGYHPVDHFRVEERFGDLELLKETVAAAHDLGLKVILDVVNNHVGKKHPFVDDLSQWRQGGFNKWFHPHAHEADSTSIFNYGVLEEVRDKELAGLPDFDQDNPHVRAFLADVSKFWIRELGLDGLRLDAVRHAHPDFWSEFNREIKAFAGDNFLLIGEVFSENPDNYRPYRNAGFDGFFDFPMQAAMTKVFAQASPMPELTEAIKASRRLGRPDDPLQAAASVPGFFIDNHDLPRFTHSVDDAFQRERTKLALAFMMGLEGMPVLYYGTEVLLAGGPKFDEKTGEGSDYLNRRMMDFTLAPREQEWDGMTTFLQKVAQARKDHPALGSGRLIELYKDAQTYIFAKSDSQGLVVTTLNASSEERYLEIPLPAGILLRTAGEAAKAGKALEAGGLLNWSQAQITASAGKPEHAQAILKVTLKPLGADMHAFNHEDDAALPDDFDFAVAESEFAVPGAVDAVFTFRTERRDIDAMSVAGNFNGWTPGAHPMTMTAPGVWTATIPLKPNVYEYKFVINGSEWIRDPAAKETKDNGFGDLNSVIRVNEPDAD